MPHPEDMWFLSSIVVPAFVSAVTIIPTAFIVLPWANRRASDRAELWAERGRMHRRIFAILTCSLLLNALPATANSESLTAAFVAERNRWRTEIDKATRELMDGITWVSISYWDALDMPTTLVRAASTMRMVWISDRPDSRKCEQLLTICEPLRDLLFTRKWNLLRNSAANMAKLLAALDAIDGQETAMPQVEWLSKVASRMRRATSSKKSAAAIKPDK
jgi:hypothetical protein